MKRIRRSLRVMWSFFSLAAGLALSSMAHASPGPEPSLLALQRAAVEAARLEPERVDRWERRLHAAALAPSLRLRVLRGGTDVLSTTDYNGNTRITVGDHAAWQFEVAATWALDRMVWHPDEMRVAREAQRMAIHRERLLVEVASLDAERRRIARRIAGGAEADVDEAQLRLVEVEAVLDGLTGGLLSRARSGLADKAVPKAPPAESAVETPDGNDGDE